MPPARRSEALGLSFLPSDGAGRDSQLFHALWPREAAGVILEERVVYDVAEAFGPDFVFPNVFVAARGRGPGDCRAHGRGSGGWVRAAEGHNSENVVAEFFRDGSAPDECGLAETVAELRSLENAEKIEASDRERLFTERLARQLELIRRFRAADSRPNISEMAEEFGVDRKTIRHDLQDLVTRGQLPESAYPAGDAG